jgi:hypothetical protein
MKWLHAAPNLQRSGLSSVSERVDAVESVLQAHIWKEVLEELTNYMEAA